MVKEVVTTYTITDNEGGIFKTSDPEVCNEQLLNMAGANLFHSKIRLKPYSDHILYQLSRDISYIIGTSFTIWEAIEYIFIGVKHTIRSNDDYAKSILQEDYSGLIKRVET